MSGLIPAVGSLLDGPSPLGPITGQEPTNLGPLTATFTQPPACTTAVAEAAGGQALLGHLAQVCGPGTGVVDTSCWPATSGGAPGPLTASPGWGFYSPGVVCPAGHTSACSATGGLFGKSDWPLQYTLSAGETAVGCCLEGYSCDNLGGQTCVQTTTSLAVPTTNCARGSGEDTGPGLAILPRQAATAVVTTLLAPMFQINWQSSDLAPGPSSAPPAPSQPVQTARPPTSSAADTPSLSGTQTISAGSSPAGSLETASSPAGLAAAGPLPTEPAAPGDAQDGNTATQAAGAEQPAPDGPGPGPHQQGGEAQGAGFPVPAVIGVSVAGGLGAMAVAVWAVYMWQRRRRYRRDMLQGISDDRMLQDLDSMYETARPKTFDAAGRETVYGCGPGRQDTFGSLRPGPDMSYGPGQETSRFFRAGPRRSPQLVGFSGITTAGGGRPDGLRDLAGDAHYAPSHYRR